MLSKKLCCIFRKVGKLGNFFARTVFITIFGQFFLQMASSLSNFICKSLIFRFWQSAGAGLWDRTLVVLGHWTVFWHSQNNKDTYLQNVHFLFFQVFIGGKYWKCPSITGKSIEEFLERFFPFSRDDIDNSITKSNKIYLSKRLSWQLVLSKYWILSVSKEKY